MRESEIQASSGLCVQLVNPDTGEQLSLTFTRERPKVRLIARYPGRQAEHVAELSPRAAQGEYDVQLVLDASQATESPLRDVLAEAGFEVPSGLSLSVYLLFELAELRGRRAMEVQGLREVLQQAMTEVVERVDHELPPPVETAGEVTNEIPPPVDVVKTSGALPPEVTAALSVTEEGRAFVAQVEKKGKRGK